MSTRPAHALPFAPFLVAYPLVALCLGGCASVVIDDGPPRPGATTPSNACSSFSATLRPGSDPQSGVNVYGAANGPGCGVIAVGSYFGVVDLGLDRTPTAADWDGWVSRFDAGGHALWSRHFGQTPASGSDGLYQVASDDAGNAWVTGYTEGPLDLGGGETLAGEGSFVLALTPDGRSRWAERLPAWPGHMAHDPDGTLSVFVATGDTLSEMVFDAASGELDMRELGRGPFGIHAAASNDSGTVLVLCASGDFVLGDQTVARRDATPDGQGNPTCDLAIARFDRDGAFEWVSTFDETGFSPYTSRVALDDRGVTTLLSSFWGTIDLGQGPRVASPIGTGMRILYAQLDDGGRVVTSEAYGDADFSFPIGVVAGEDGETLLSGTVYNGSIDLGDGAIASNALGYMGFEAEVDASGAVVSSDPHAEVEQVFPSAGHAPLFVDRRMSEDGRDLGVVITRESDASR